MRSRLHDAPPEDAVRSLKAYLDIGEWRPNLC
jgi:hypothetical protein